MQDIEDSDFTSGKWLDHAAVFCVVCFQLGEIHTSKLLFLFVSDEDGTTWRHGRNLSSR
jgi:hypothetical protein